LARSGKIFNEVIESIKAGQSDKATEALFNMYSTNYHKAITSVFESIKPDSRYFAITEEFKLNTARLAAYKSNYASDLLLKAYEKDPKNFAFQGEKTLKMFNRWQATEYNTAVARCRTAKQFMQFEEKADLFPNLEWLPSRSVHIREEHAAFYGLILPINDPFWQTNQPGNLYNCKCDWQQTDKEVSGAAPKSVKPHAGLDGNPTRTGEIFTDKHPYFNKAGDIQNKLASVDYTDNIAKFPISVIAHKTEIADNVATARILKDNFKNIDVRIREHVTINGLKNPEYTINGFISDAKRLKKYEGINNGFSNALSQGCKSVIIDFNKHYDISKTINIEKTIGRILQRESNFVNNEIIECYIVFGKKACLIKKGDIYIERLTELLKELMP